MDNTRVFVSGLPPTLTNDALRKHFASHFEVTDAHVIPNRRIGFVGFKSGSSAQDAIKYFNKSYIRMSKIALELARPVDADPVNARSRYNKTAVADGKPSSETDKSLKRKRDSNDEGEDPALKEYLSIVAPSRKSKTWADGDININGNLQSQTANTATDSRTSATQSHDDGPTRNKKSKSEITKSTDPALTDEAGLASSNDATAPSQLEATKTAEPQVEQAPQSDADWLRSRTSRLLGLIEEDEEEQTPFAEANSSDEENSDRRKPEPEPISRTDPELPSTNGDDSVPQKEEPPDANISAIHTSGRLFVRNLPYKATEDDLQPLFTAFGKIDEIHVAFDVRHSASKGFAYVQYLDHGSAVQAYKELDGKDFQGRLLHILPASSKKTYKLNEFEISKLPLKKQQQIKRKAEAATSTFTWNSLYMNTDAVMASVAERLGVSKSDILDPTSSDAAVKQAHAETHVIQETKAYFTNQGVNLDSFKQRERGNTAILVKNFSYGVKADELKKLFEPYGEITRLLMPPSGTIAIIEFAMPDEAQKAFKGLAYRKLGDSILYLEKAPKNLFEGGPAMATAAAPGQKTVSKQFSTSDTFRPDEPEAVMETSTLFIRNLNFSTTDSGLASVFEPLEGFLSAKVKTKPDPKNAGERLSMGFGFVEFRTRSQAQAALASMNRYKLDQHELVIKASHKGADAAEQQRREDNAQKVAARRTKIIIKNLPFQATKKDVRSLFGAYGQLRSVRVPKKYDRSARGFAFADFISAREAENAMDALKSTHLLGRRLVLEFASGDAVDPEEEIQKLEKKADAQVNKVKMKQLTGSGRKKFHVNAGEEE